MATVSTTRNNRLIRIDAPALGHIPAFDGLRGVFVLLVVFYHAQLTPFLGGMPLVIDWFFVSSGFLITSLMLDERNKHGAVSLRNFYTRRVLRLFPAMYAMLAVFTIMAVIATVAVKDSSEFSNWWVDVVSGAFYVFNFVAAADPQAVSGAIGHIWSLTVEEQFYFIWPLVLLFVLRKANRRTDMRLIVGSVLFIALFIFLRSHFQYIVSDADPTHPTFIDQDDPTWQGFLYRFASMRPDMIVYGCLIAFVARAIPRPVPHAVRRFLAVIGPISWVWFAAVLFGANTGLWGFELWGGPAYQVALLLLGPGVLDTYFRPKTFYSRAAKWKPISWLGLRAYGVYLWHVLPLLVFLPAINNANGLEKLVLASLASFFGVLAGLGSFRFIERRFLAMKGRFQGPATPAVPDAAAKVVADADAGLLDLAAQDPDSPSADPPAINEKPGVG
ncbi:MAG: acyltransferase [Actinomycetia bacterium]|nr:acyltransferase [Actinomycetes bacterium]